MATYSAAFIEQALQKAYSRGDRTIMSVAAELNISHHALRYWMKKKEALSGSPAPAKEKRPSDWTIAEQLQALQESYALHSCIGITKNIITVPFSLSRQLNAMPVWMWNY